MSKNGHWFFLILAVAFGFAGGIVSNVFFVGSPVLAEKTSPAVKFSAAEEFRLVDKDGNTRAKLGQTADETTGFFIYDKNGKSRVELSLFAGGIPGVVLYDKDEKPRAQMTLSREGEPDLVFNAKDGDPLAGLRLTPDAEAHFYLRHHKGGNPHLDLLVAEDGMTRLDFTDQEGKPRVRFGLKADGSPGLVLQTKDGKIGWSIPEK